MSKKFSDFESNPDTVLTTPAPGDLCLIYDQSEPLGVNKIKVISYQNLVNLAAQAALQALASGQAAGDLFYASGPASLARLAKGTAGQSLKMNSGGTAPVWGNSSGLSCYGYFSSGGIAQGASTVWTDITGATTDIAVPVISTLFAVATGVGFMTSIGNGLVRWFLDGTAGQREANIGSVNVPISDNFAVLGIKTNVAAGTKTCKLQYQVSSGDVINISGLLGFVLGFAE